METYYNSLITSSGLSIADGMVGMSIKFSTLLNRSKVLDGNPYDHPDFIHWKGKNIATFIMGREDIDMTKFNERLEALNDEGINGITFSLLTWAISWIEGKIMLNDPTFEPSAYNAYPEGDVPLLVTIAC